MTRGGSKGKRVAISEENPRGKRKSKGRGGSSSRGAPSQVEEAPSPTHPRISMGMRPISTGRRILFNFLKEIGLNVGNLIENQGWFYYCSLKIPSYPNLIRTFYENISIEDDFIESIVKGQKIVLNDSILGEILHMPSDGRKILIIKDREKVLRRILERSDVNPAQNVKANVLSLEMRLLHHFVCRIFLQRSGTFSWVTERDLCFMFSLLEGEPLNLPGIMLIQMKETLRKVRTSLPFGMALTLVFKSVGIDLSGEDCRFLHHTDTYTSHSLQRMGYECIEGSWKKKNQSSDDSDEELEVRRHATEIETQVDRARTPPLPPSSIPSSSSTPPIPPSSIPSSSSTPSLSIPPIPAPSIHTTSTSSIPSISQAFLVQQLRTYTQNLSNSITSCFKSMLECHCKSIDAKFDKLDDRMTALESEVRSLKKPADLPPPDTDFVALQQSLERTLFQITEELRQNSMKMGKMETALKIEEDYVTGLGILRGEFGRMRGAAEAFTGLQAQQLTALMDSIKDMGSKLDTVWFFLSKVCDILNVPLQPITSHASHPPPHSSYARKKGSTSKK